MGCVCCNAGWVMAPASTLAGTQTNYGYGGDFWEAKYLSQPRYINRVCSLQTG